MARIKLTIPERKAFTARIPVRITDINYGNHLGNDAVVSIMQEARMQWLASVGYTELAVEGTSLILADLAVEYKNESFYGDVLYVAIAVDEIQKVSFNIYYEISTDRNGKRLLIGNAKTGMVCFNYELKKVAAVPEKLKLFLEK